LAHQERVNIAVFIDFDNIEIGVRSTLGEHFDVGTILEALRERGEVVTKIAYADWTRAGEYSRALTQHAIRLVQRNLTPGGDKNGADINLALDALEMAFTHPHINAYVIVGGDSDFLSLVEKLKQYDKKVFVVGGRAFTSVILQRNCHEFIAYENLMRKPAARGGRPAPPVASSPLAQAFPIVRRALKILADREVSPQTGLLKSTLLQLDSTFSERNYGASSFLDFTEKLSQAGLVTLKHSGRSVMVELNPGFADDGSGETIRRTGEGEESNGTVAEAPVVRVEGEPVAAMPRPAPEEPVTRLGDNAEGVRIAGGMLAGATNARWPMYLRNAKQILRAASFDERKYGFGGLIDLLKACQRDGLVRIERDRRGGLRVFQGPALRNMAPIASSAPAAPAIFDIENELGPDGELREPPVMVETIIIEDTSEPEPEQDTEPVELQPVSVVDTTAELLGRATGKRSRTRAATTTSVNEDKPARGNRAPRRPASRKPAADSGGNRRGRGRKPSGNE
jgi:uncharacterized LabA/DUF88 family protein